MDKGQHLRLVIMSTAATPVAQFVALATELTVHFSAQTEDATTKDTTDTTGSWLVYDVTGRSGDIQFGALLAVNDGQAMLDSQYDSLYAANFIDMVSDTEVDWRLLLTSGSQNRTKSKTICTGKGKLTNLQMTGQNRQNASYSGTLTLFGPVTVGSD